MAQDTERIDLISEFRTPTKWHSKLAIALLALIFFMTLSVAAVSAYLLYRILLPARSHADLNLKNFPGRPEALPYSVPGESTRDGWFFPGLKSAPTVVLCPAYQSTRGELLTLASALQDHQYNVLVFDFSGHGSNIGRTTLGYQEVSELRAVIDAVANRGDVDPNRFGVWGVNLGAYVAMAEAMRDRRVRALAVESPYNRPEDMLRLLVTRSGIGSLPFVASMSRLGFRWIEHDYRAVPPLSANMTKLEGVGQLYLESTDDAALAAQTNDLFRISSPPHELVVLQQGNYASMVDEEKRNYESRIVSFFLTSMPPGTQQ